MKNIFALSILSITALHAGYRQELAEEMSIFFNYAQQEYTKFKQGIMPTFFPHYAGNGQEILKIEIENHAKTYHIIDLIAAGNSNDLKACSFDDLEYMKGQIWVPAHYFKNTADGGLDSEAIAAENAVGYLILYSALDATKDKQPKLLEMLDILCNKGLNLNKKIAVVYFIKDTPEDTAALDYVGYYSFLEAVLTYSTPEIFEFLLQHGAKDDKEKLLTLIEKMKTHPHFAQEDTTATFEALIHKYL